MLALLVPSFPPMQRMPPESEISGAQILLMPSAIATFLYISPPQCTDTRASGIWVAQCRLEHDRGGPREHLSVGTMDERWMNLIGAGGCLDLVTKI